MNYFVEMASGGMIHKPSFINIASGAQKLLRGTHINTQKHMDNK
jgi:hypothetical protein